MAEKEKRFLVHFNADELDMLKKASKLTGSTTQQTVRVAVQKYIHPILQDYKEPTYQEIVEANVSKRIARAGACGARINAGFSRGQFSIDEKLYSMCLHFGDSLNLKAILVGKSDSKNRRENAQGWRAYDTLKYCLKKGIEGNTIHSKKTVAYLNAKLGGYFSSFQYFCNTHTS